MMVEALFDLELREVRMLHIACCGTIPIVDADTCCREVFEQCAAETGLGADDFTIDAYESPFALIENVTGAKSLVAIDIVVCGAGTTGLSGIEFVRDLRDAGYTEHIVMCVDDSASAFEAISLNVEGFLVQPVALADMRNLFVRMLSTVAQNHEHSIELRTREGARRIDLRRLVYATTAGHDQELHMVDGSSTSVRMSSQAFFDLVSHSGRFFKAGSSYIVNINLVRRVDQRSSSARLADGTNIPIPGRVRKALEEAVLTNE